jgi:hypothetical protein
MFTVFYKRVLIYMTKKHNTLCKYMRVALVVVHKLQNMFLSL